MPINRDALYRPVQHEILHVRGSKENKTTEWALTVDRFEQEGNRIRIYGSVIGADFATGIDSRLTNQKESIERLAAENARLREELDFLRGETSE